MGAGQVWAREVAHSKEPCALSVHLPLLNFGAALSRSRLLRLAVCLKLLLGKAHMQAQRAMGTLQIELKYESSAS